MNLPATGRWKPFLHVLAFFLLTALVLVAASIVARQLPGWPEEVVIGAVGVMLTILLTAAFLSWDHKRFPDIGLAWELGTSKRFFLGLLIGFILVALHLAAIASSGHVIWVRNPHVDIAGAGITAIGYGLLALREELAFRAYPLRTLLPPFGALGAQMIVMFAFIAEHRLGGATWSTAVLGSGLGALVFGMAALVTRGIALPLGIHLAWNVGDWMRGGKGGHGPWSMRVDPEYSMQLDHLAMTAYVVVMLAVFLDLYFSIAEVRTHNISQKRGSERYWPWPKPLIIQLPVDSTPTDG